MAMWSGQLTLPALPPLRSSLPFISSLHSSTLHPIACTPSCISGLAPSPPFPSPNPLLMETPPLPLYPALHVATAQSHQNGPTSGVLLVLTQYASRSITHRQLATFAILVYTTTTSTTSTPTTIHQSTSIHHSSATPSPTPPTLKKPDHDRHILASTTNLPP